jgi:molecular chaperone DnaK (HSP70)
VKESDVALITATTLRRCSDQKSGVVNNSNIRPKQGVGTVSGSAHPHPHGGSSSSSSSPLKVMLPSLIGLLILGVAVMGKMGFRGRPTVAGIDLGTTNSVICVQEQKAEVIIHCIRDPTTNSPIIPSVVSFLPVAEGTTGGAADARHHQQQHHRHIHHHHHHHHHSSVSADLKLLPDNVVVGTAAKEMIASHPHTTIYHAKRILGRHSSDPAIAALQSEVEFTIGSTTMTTMTPTHDADAAGDDDTTTTTPAFIIPELYAAHHEIAVSPARVGEYVIRYLRQLVVDALSHDAVRTAVICVPAQFDQLQRAETVRAVTNAGFTVSRVLEEPVAAALAYGLHRAQGTIFVLVYDFGGGTLDVSVLQLSGSDYVDVLSTDGDDQLGGSNFDTAIADHLRHTFLSSASGLAIIEADLEEQVLDRCGPTEETQQHRHFCTLASLHVIGEEFKIGLSNLYGDDTATVLDDGRKRELVVTSQCWTVPADQQQQQARHSGSDDGSSIDIDCDKLIAVPLSLSLYDFETTVAAPLLDRAIRPIHRVLQSVSMDHTDMDEVVMVGGTTRMPIVRQLVHAALPQATLNTHIDPDITVAYGAASVMD